MLSQSGFSAKTIVLSIFITVCIVVLIFFGVTQTSQLTNAREELATTQIDLTATQADLASTESLLAISETELNKTQYDLTAALSELSDTQSELDTTSQNLEDKTSQLAQVQADYTQSLKALDTEQELSTELQSSLANLQANYNSLTAGYGYVLKDPTYQQVKAFIAADSTDANTYVDDTYVCEDFSFDVKVHAMQQKIRCAYVSIRFVGETSGHAIVAFNTTDRGIIYIEPQSDEEANLQVGKHYWTQCLITTVHYTTTFDDTIERFNVIW